MTVSILEVAEAMYRAACEESPYKQPESLDELNPRTQHLFLRRAEAAIAVTGQGSEGPVSVPQLVLDLNNPGKFSDRVREVFDRYVAVVGEERVTDEVRKAMAI